MSQDAPTPRTDEESYDWHPEDGKTDDKDGYFVDADFARKLERELSAANARAETAEAALAEAKQTIAQQHYKFTDDLGQLSSELCAVERQLAAEREKNAAYESAARELPEIPEYNPHEYESLLDVAQELRAIAVAALAKNANGEAWKSYAEHQEWCTDCAINHEDCHTGKQLKDAARGDDA